MLPRSDCANAREDARIAITNALCMTPPVRWVRKYHTPRGGVNEW
jgi:hypothetical protein